MTSSPVGRFWELKIDKLFKKQKSLTGTKDRMVASLNFVQKSKSKPESGERESEVTGGLWFVVRKDAIHTLPNCVRSAVCPGLPDSFPL